MAEIKRASVKFELYDWFDLLNLSFEEQGRPAYFDFSSFLEDLGSDEQSIRENILLAWEGDMFVGYLYAKDAYVFDVWVVPLFRGQGIASQLLETYKSQANKSLYQIIVKEQRPWAGDRGLEKLSEIIRYDAAIPNDQSLPSVSKLNFVPFNMTHQPHWQKSLEKWSQQNAYEKARLENFQISIRGQALLHEGNLVGGIKYRVYTDPYRRTGEEALPKEGAPPRPRVLEIVDLSLDPKHTEKGKLLVNNVLAEALSLDVHEARTQIVTESQAKDLWPERLGWKPKFTEEIWTLN